ncbi:hypothetical protein VTK73DRAFT_1687 [Phialemonium thermophilum]|uniref:Uncharacterized protein n=1 Tax=Phialemonium thermophilum TaxID=223376 RepID=A0ABR3VT38_9PEZI
MISSQDNVGRRQKTSLRRCPQPDPWFTVMMERTIIRRGLEPQCRTPLPNRQRESSTNLAGRDGPQHSEGVLLTAFLENAKLGQDGAVVDPGTGECLLDAAPENLMPARHERREQLFVSPTARVKAVVYTEREPASSAYSRSQGASPPGSPPLSPRHKKAREEEARAEEPEQRTYDKEIEDGEGEGQQGEQQGREQQGREEQEREKHEGLDPKTPENLKRKRLEQERLLRGVYKQQQWPPHGLPSDLVQSMISLSALTKAIYQMLLDINRVRADIDTWLAVLRDRQMHQCRVTETLLRSLQDSESFRSALVELQLAEYHTKAMRAKMQTAALRMGVYRRPRPSHRPGRTWVVRDKQAGSDLAEQEGPRGGPLGGEDQNSEEQLDRPSGSALDPTASLLPPVADCLTEEGRRPAFATTEVVERHLGEEGQDDVKERIVTYRYYYDVVPKAGGKGTKAGKETLALGKENSMPEPEPMSE